MNPQPPTAVRSPEVQIDGEFTLLAGSTVKSDPQGVSNADSAIRAYLPSAGP